MPLIRVISRSTAPASQQQKDKVQLNAARAATKRLPRRDTVHRHLSALHGKLLVAVLVALLAAVASVWGGTVLCVFGIQKDIANQSPSTKHVDNHAAIALGYLTVIGAILLGVGIFIMVVTCVYIFDVRNKRERLQQLYKTRTVEEEEQEELNRLREVLKAIRDRKWNKVHPAALTVEPRSPNFVRSALKEMTLHLAHTVRKLSADQDSRLDSANGTSLSARRYNKSARSIVSNGTTHSEASNGNLATLTSKMMTNGTAGTTCTCSKNLNSNRSDQEPDISMVIQDYDEEEAEITENPHDSKGQVQLDQHGNESTFTRKGPLNEADSMTTRCTEPKENSMFAMSIKETIKMNGIEDQKNHTCTTKTSSSLSSADPQTVNRHTPAARIPETTDCETPQTKQLISVKADVNANELPNSNTIPSKREEEKRPVMIIPKVTITSGIQCRIDRIRRLSECSEDD